MNSSASGSRSLSRNGAGSIALNICRNSATCTSITSHFGGIGSPAECGSALTGRAPRPFGSVSARGVLVVSRNRVLDGVVSVGIWIRRRRVACGKRAFDGSIERGLPNPALLFLVMLMIAELVRRFHECLQRERTIIAPVRAQEIHAIMLVEAGAFNASSP